MKTKMEKQTKVPKEVKQYETARKKFIAAMEKAEKLRNTPAVLKFMKMKDPNPLQPSAEEQRKRQLDRLYGDYLTDTEFLKDQLWILCELTNAVENGNACLPNLGATLTELDNRMDKTMETIKKAFGLLDIGVGQKEKKAA